MPPTKQAAAPVLTLLATAVIAITAPFIGAVVLAGGGSAVANTPSRVAADRPCPAAPAPQTTPRADYVAVPVAAAAAPSTLALHPSSSRNGVLGQRGGQLIRVSDGRLTGEVVHDMSDDTAQEGDGGLLAAVYGPAGDWLYVYRTTAGLDDVITAFASGPDGTIDPGRSRRILTVEREPSKQHHGGSMLFGADGYLYVGLGDGGGLGDPRENSQDLRSILGKLIRIDPTPEDSEPYRIPPDNPFVDTFGARPEVWASGLRNPFRMTLQTGSDALWVGDVGQSCWEEVNRLTHSDAGANLGWDRMEGFAPFEGGELRGSRHHEPVLAIPHSAGWCAIVVGTTLPDSAPEGLGGALLFTDYCSGRLWALPATHAGEGQELYDLELTIPGPIAIVDGPAGLPWLMTLDGPIFELRPSVSRAPAGQTEATP